MSLFGDLDLQSADDNPWVKADGTYRCALVGISVKPTKKGDKDGITLEFKILQTGKNKGQKITPWYHIPKKEELTSKDEDTAANAARAAATLKMIMTNMGVPNDQLNTMQAQDLMDLGYEYDVTIQNKNGSENVRSIAVASEEEGKKYDPFS